jgi:hypothetical protein
MRKTLMVLALGLVLAASASFAAEAPPSPEQLLAEVAAAAALQTPTPVALACGPYCDCPGCYTTVTATGTGSTCANAQTALTNQLKQVANASCGTAACQFTMTYTQACTQINGSTWQTTGYGRHGCRDNSC